MSMLAHYWSDLALVFVAFALVVGSPGPSTLAIMGTSMSDGRSSGLTLALGVSASSLTWGILSALGISALLAAYEPALYGIRLAGGLYLLFLAWRSARAALQPQDLPSSGHQATGEPKWRTFSRGYLMHLTNPKAILGWLAIMTLGLKPDMPQAIVPVMLAGCLAISLMFNCGYAVLFSTEPMVRAYRRARRWIQSSLAGFFAFAGYKLLTTR